MKGLALQLVAEIQCLRPGTLKSIESTPGLALDSAVFPYLQTAAAAHLVATQKARGVTMAINSASSSRPPPSWPALLAPLLARRTRRHPRPKPGPASSPPLLRSLASQRPTGRLG